MPSTGNTPRQRWPSCENSTRWIGEWSSLTSKVMIVLPAIDAHAARRQSPARVLSTLERRAVELAGRAPVPAGFDGASEATIFTK